MTALLGVPDRDAADRTCADLLGACRDPVSEDDATILVLHRDPAR